LKYAAQVIPQIDAEIVKKSHLWMETRYIFNSLPGARTLSG